MATTTVKTNVGVRRKPRKAYRLFPWSIALRLVMSYSDPILLDARPIVLDVRRWGQNYSLVISAALLNVLNVACFPCTV